MENKEMIQDGKKQKRKRVLLISIIAVVFIGIVIWAINVIPVANFYKTEWIDSGEFVSNWNEKSEEFNLLTNGIEISDAKGEHTYLLENGATLKYTVDSYWWVKYIDQGVTLEFQEDEQEQVYELSEMLLEMFEGIRDKESVLKSALDEVAAQKTAVILSFTVNKHSNEYYAKFVKESVMKSDSYIGYSWKLTMDEWCENFNNGLESAIEAAAQEGCEYMEDLNLVESIDASVKDELIERYRGEYKSISVSDFRKTAILTDGIHENVVYTYKASNINQITLVIDENGYITACECSVARSAFDTIKQYASGDIRILFMEICGYPAMACAGTGVSCSAALNNVEDLFSDVTTKKIADTVWFAGGVENQSALSFICLPNRDGTVDNFMSFVSGANENWKTINTAE